MKKIILAALRLPLVAQRILATGTDIECRTALAASPHTDPDVLSTLTRDHVPAVRRFAHMRTDDVDLLRSELGRPTAGISTPYAARNPLAPVELLTRALGSNSPQVSLGAYINPSTPEAERRKLTVARASEITAIGGSNHDTVVRAHELAANNPWMLETTDTWDGNVRRALAGLPQASTAQLDAIRAAGRSGYSAVHNHPSKRSEFTEHLPSAWPTKALVEFGGPAIDLIALARPDFDEKSARAVLNRLSKATPEPHIIGRIVNRFGPEIFSAETLPALVRISGTRYKAAAWLAPIMGLCSFDMILQWQDTNAAIALLGENRHAWETYLSLVDGSWHGTAVQAAETALTV